MIQDFLAAEIVLANTDPCKSLYKITPNSTHANEK